MFTSDQDASLTNLGQGAAVEKFDYELKRAIADLLDVNKDGTKARTITLKVTLKPGATQGIVDTTIECNAKLADRKPFATNLMVGRDATGIQARELFQQRPLPLEEVKEKVVDFEKKQ